MSINKDACCCCVVLEAAIRRPQFQSARPPPLYYPLVKGEVIAAGALQQARGCSVFGGFLDGLARLLLVCSQRPALGQAYGVVTFGAGFLGFKAPRPRAAARIHLSPGGSRVATPRTLAVCSSTHLEPPWLRRPEACGCVRVPYAHLLIAGGG